jgi:hypothetical protein
MCEAKRRKPQVAALWLGYLDRIIACAEGIAKTTRIKDDDARVLAACLLARSISTGQRGRAPYRPRPRSRGADAHPVDI